ncbi:MAG: UTP--glucose-1-phosphate uridylyltransferase [Acidimicrobiales bacterium]|nr:MAG: UTP--glucose-1-phosphate uridylyltransferase [Acidimicrobiales bacterium]
MADASVHTPVSKVVIPVAGLGTRFLPATKTIPKVLLPVVDRPALEYIVEEASRAGLDDVLLVIGRGQDSVLDHFDRRPELEAALEAKGDKARLDAVRHSAELATMHAVRQDEPRGLGHAVLCAQRHVGRESFAVQLGDDMIDPRDPLLPAMLDVQRRYGGVVLGLIEVPSEHIHRYGCVAATPTGETFDGYSAINVSALVEKPTAEQAPSNLAIIGRYVLPPEVFDAIRATPPGAGGEIQLTDAIARLLYDGMPVHGVIFTGRRYDTGDRSDYLKAVVQLAVERDDLGPEFRAWLSEFVRAQ